MQKALDTRYHFSGMHGCPSHCHLRAYVPGPAEAGQAPVILVTQSPDNPGTSITNFSEKLAAEVWALLECPMGMVWIENYEAHSAEGGRQTGRSLMEETFRRVEFDATPGAGDGPPVFSGLRWLQISRREVEALVGQPVAPIARRPAS